MLAAQFLPINGGPISRTSAMRLSRLQSAGFACKMGDLGGSFNFATDFFMSRRPACCCAVCLPYRAQRISVVKNASHNFAYVRVTFSTENGCRVIRRGSGNSRSKNRNSAAAGMERGLVSEVDSRGVWPRPNNNYF